MQIKGLYTAVITPFDIYGKIDTRGLRQNLRFQLQAKVDGIVILGTTGETPTLTEEEKELVIEIALEEVKGKTHLMIGTGSYSTEKTISDTRKAKEAGADSVLIVCPYYNKPTQEGLYLHFKAIAENVNIPIIVYNHQGRTGQNLQTETLQRIAQLPNIVGVKDASGQISQMSDVIEQVVQRRPNFSILSGDDSLTMPLMAMGGQGVISVLANFIPAPIKQMVEAAAQGDFSTARALHYKLMPIFRAGFIETNPIPLKAMMNMAGLPAGPCRLPLCDLQPSNYQKVKTILDTHQDIWSNATKI